MSSGTGTISAEENRFLAQLRREYPDWTIHRKANGYVAWKQSIYAPDLGALAGKLDKVAKAPKAEARPEP